MKVGALFEILLFGLFVNALEAWGSSNSKVKLSDVKTLTLYNGQMTTGRRTRPVPQLQCVGGSAGCKKFVPQVVQCYNRGSDGFDVQWECKTDMDNAYRFGSVDVICEGYDYPDDPYILKGSCGLEYKLDLTEEGLKRSGNHNYYGDSDNSYGSKPHTKSSTGAFSNFMLTIIGLLLMYALYRTCIRRYQYSPTGDSFDDTNDSYRSGYGFFNQGTAPPPPGFRSSPYSDAGCNSSNMGFGSASNMGFGSARTPGANNFWTGAMTGGLLGYMFGSRNTNSNQGYSSYFQQPTRTYGWGESSSSNSGSTGTRTASGYGGTRRR